MQFTEQEKQLAKSLKESGLAWNPQEGDWFWATEEFSHQFYLGESVPSSFFFRKGEAYVFDSAMTWHIQQGGLKPDKFVWLPQWAQCRAMLAARGYTLELRDESGNVHIQAKNANHSLTATGNTDLEALYALLQRVLKN